VTFPFDPGGGLQPETLARVLRSNESESGWQIALQFERAAHSASGNGKTARGDRNGACKNVALPIHVRPEHVPWYEEAMTIEASPGRVKFLTNREYAFGEKLLVSFAAGGEAEGNVAEEWEGEVTGVEMEAGKEAVVITVRRRLGE